MSNKTLPNPGSDAAILAGCTCPVLDNHHGRGFGDPENPRFWISGNCEIHGCPPSAKEVNP